MKNFINNYFNDTDYFYIFMLNNKDTTDFKQFLHTKESFNKFYQKIKYYNNLKYSIYYSYNSFEKIDNCIFRQKKYVKSIKSVIFDIDEDYEDKTTQDILNTIKTYKKPTYIIQTSPNKYQIIYKLKNEITDKSLFKSYEIELEKLINIFKTDKNVKDISKLLRLPRSINHKNQFLTQIIEENEETYNIEDFFELYELSEDTQNPQETILKDKSIPTHTQTPLTPYIEDLEVVLTPYVKRIWTKTNETIQDPSRTDILFIKRRSKMDDKPSYNKIFNEILEIRKLEDKSLKRDLQQYFNDRKQFYNN